MGSAGKMQKASTHLFSRVSFKFTVVEVCVGVVINIDAPALCQRKSEHVTFQRGAGGRFKQGSKSDHYKSSIILRDDAIGEVCLTAFIDVYTSALQKKRGV